MKSVLIAVLSLFLASRTVAQTIAVATYRTGAAAGSESLGELETGALDVFFATGFIVTSSKLGGEGGLELTEELLAEARSGYIEYFLALEPYFPSSAKPGDLPLELRYTIVRISDGYTIASNLLPVVQTAFSKPSDRVKALRALGGNVARQSILAVRGVIGGKK